jgi:hypothetical protein
MQLHHPIPQGAGAKCKHQLFGACAMTIGQLLVLYLLAGCAVAVAFFVTTAAGSRAERLLQFAASLVFWPLYLTLLLSRSAPSAGGRPAGDELGRALTDAQSALQSLDDWEDGVLAHEQVRLDELRAALARIAAAVDELSALPQKDERVQAHGGPVSPGNRR